MNKFIDDLNKLVELKTVAGNDIDFENSFTLLNGWFEPLGLQRTNFIDGGVKSVVWSNSPGDLSPDVLFSAHIDVVPASESMYKVEVSGDRLCGRGVSDMKFAVVSFKHVLEKLRDIHKFPNNVAVMITTDEEEGGLNGTNYLVNNIGYRPKIVILPDGGEDFRLVTEAKGVLHLKATAHGKAAHAAYPWEGESANDLLIDFLRKLRSLYPQLNTEKWINTLNIGKLYGGTQTNQVSESAEASLDFRYVYPTSANFILEQVGKVDPRIIIEKIVEADFFKVNLQDPYIVNWQQVVEKVVGDGYRVSRDHGTSDARFFSPYNIPVIMTKPMAGGDHSEEEWLDINSWELYQKCLGYFLVSL